MSHSPKLKLLDSTMKTVKIEMVSRAEKGETKEEASQKEAEASKRPQPIRTSRKTVNFFMGRVEELAPYLVGGIATQKMRCHCEFL